VSIYGQHSTSWRAGSHHWSFKLRKHHSINLCPKSVYWHENSRSEAECKCYNPTVLGNWIVFFNKTIFEKISNKRKLERIYSGLFRPKLFQKVDRFTIKFLNWLRPNQIRRRRTRSNSIILDGLSVYSQGFHRHPLIPELCLCLWQSYPSSRPPKTPCLNRFGTLYHDRFWKKFHDVFSACYAQRASWGFTTVSKKERKKERVLKQESANKH